MSIPSLKIVPIGQRKEQNYLFQSVSNPVLIERKINTLTNFLSLSLFLLIASIQAKYNTFNYRKCLLQPEAGWRVSAFIVGSNPDNPINGIITFKPWDAAHVLVNVSITGLPPGRHATHFHAFGDLSQGCASTGPHFRSNLVNIAFITFLHQ